MSQTVIHSLQARVEVEPVGDAPVALVRLWLGDILLRWVPCSTDVQIQKQRDTADRINALIDARVSELLAANNVEVERRRVIEGIRERAAEDARLWRDEAYRWRDERAAIALELRRVRHDLATREGKGVA